MNTQRVLLLSFLALIFVGAATLSFRQIWDESHTRFRAGLPIPKDIIPKQLLTQAELNAGGPPIAPEIRSTDPILSGDVSSPITIIEFGDYQSQLSKQQDTAITQAISKLGKPELVRTIWRDLPNTAEHSKAIDAIIAVRCAGDQGKFKAMHNLVLQTSQSFDSMEFLRFARRIGVKEETYLTCTKDPKWTSTSIPNDISLATDLAITQVPTIFINDVPYQGFVDADTIYGVLKRVQPNTSLTP